MTRQNLIANSGSGHFLIVPNTLLRYSPTQIAIPVLAALLCLLAWHGDARADQGTSPLPKPDPFRYVVDNAGVIDSATNERMEKILRDLKSSGDIEFAVVTVKTTGDQDIFDYSLAVARGWGIGPREGEKNGLLLLVAIDDRKYQIQVSRHLEGDLPDGLVGEIGRRMRDPFRRNDYSGGLMIAVQTIVSTLEEKRGFNISDVDKKFAYRADTEQPARRTGIGFSPCVIFLVVIFIIILAISSRRRGGGGGGGGWLNWLLLSMILNSGSRGSGWGSGGSSGWSGGGFGGSGGGGFGGGGFGGGGDFGGGGAGGSW